MKNLVLASGLLLFFSLAGCAQNSAPAQEQQTAEKTETNLSTEEALKLMGTDKNLVVLDVRTPEEYAKGHIKDAKNVDFLSDDFQKQISQLDPSKTYLLYCASGNRSGKATKVLKEKNFSRVYNSTAGFKELKSEGAPTN